MSLQCLMSYSLLKNLAVAGVLGRGKSLLRFGVQSRSSPGRFRGVPSIMKSQNSNAASAERKKMRSPDALLFNFPRVTSLSTACKQSK